MNHILVFPKRSRDYALGSMLGYALLGSLVGEHAAFVPGMHIAMGFSGTAFLLACLLSLLFVKARRARA